MRKLLSAHTDGGGAAVAERPARKAVRRRSSREVAEPAARSELGQKMARAAKLAKEKAGKLVKLTREKAEAHAKKWGVRIPSWDECKAKCWAMIKRGKEMLLVGLDIAGKVVFTLGVLAFFASPIDKILGAAAAIGAAFWRAIAYVFGFQWLRAAHMGGAVAMTV